MNPPPLPVGTRVGRLTVFEVYRTGKRRDQFRLRCRCDCGEVIDRTSGQLRHGSNKSCGCLRRDQRAAANRKHGKSRTTEYHMFCGARRRSRERGLPFALRLEDIVIPERCPVLGFVLSTGNRDTRPSLDRIVPHLGYTPSNVMVISYRANRIKSDASVDELRAILAYAERRGP